MQIRRVLARIAGNMTLLQSVVPVEVRVEIEAAGVSFVDRLMREGVHPETPRGTMTLGWDLVGGCRQGR